MGVRSIVAAARKLRRSSTDVERKLWHRIRDKQIEDFRFRRQRPIGKYIVDFVCLDAMLIIEVDGSQHAEAIAADVARTQFLESLGYRVVRFWNNEVIDNVEGVLERVREALLQLATSNPTPTLPLAGEGAGYASANASTRTPSSAPRGKQPPGLRRAGMARRSKKPPPPSAVPLAGEGAGQASADVSVRTPSLAPRGKQPQGLRRVGMGVRSKAGAANKDTKATGK
jgi:adenine-specific DNA-methyltransferase